jgi:hypothetical protein
MEDDRRYFEERAAQCRRLAQSVDDRRTTEQLTVLAQEFEAKAERAAAEEGPGH